MQGFENFIGFNPWTALFTLLNMVLTFLILKKFLFKPVQKVMNARREQVDRIYSDANESLSSADQMKQEYERRLANARMEADDMIRSATQTAQRRGDQIVEEAKAQAEHTRKKADAEIAQQKQQMLKDVRGEISDLAVSIASKVVEREINQQDYDGLVNDFIRNAGDGA